MALRPLDRLPSIRAKLGSVIVFAVAVTILMMYLAVGFAFRQLERDREFRELLVEAQTVAALGFNASGRPSRALVDAIAEDPSGVVVVGAGGRPLVGRLPVPPSVGRVLQGGIDTGTMGRREYIGVPVNRQGRVIGALYLSHPVEGGGVAGAVIGTASFVRSVWWQLLLAGAVAAFIALFLARILARGMTQPLRDMAGAARSMARGDYRQRVPVRSRDEVGQLAEAFNRMAGEVEGLERLRRELVANVSHELKTPISALRARLENLLDGVERPEPALLATMLQQSERLSRLVEQLLDLSLLESGDVPLDREPVPLGPLVERVVEEVRASRPGRDIRVRNLVPEDLPPVEADRERLHQVLFNLLDNAYRFTPTGGTVTVTAAVAGQECEVTVEDTGPGIPPEHLPLVFERFYRVDPSRSREDGGTGIGLAIARSVVEAHGGRIWAEDADGRGARFRFVLPAARRPQLPARAGGEAPPPSRATVKEGV
jgi:signal transduction histidine kinase